MTKTKRKWAIVAAVSIAVIAAAAWFAWDRAARWRPPLAEYPQQGALVRAANGAAPAGRLIAGGVRFAFFEATSGESGANPAFEANVRGARAAGLPWGIAHRYDLCGDPEAQAANVSRHVARDAAALPPVVILDRDRCASLPRADALTGELTVFLNQFESHLGKRAILLPDRGVARLGITDALGRDTIAVRDFAPPAAREDATPGLWQASDWARIDGVDGALRWIVVYPGP